MTNNNGQEYLTKQLRPFLTAFLVAGVQNVVLSPGSRSTPIAILLGQLEDQGRLHLYVNIDERSAGFFALGLAKTTGQPVLLVCTSGTAAANYYPAICEAQSSNVPLVVLTTDRPPELQEIGTPQTLAQDYLYGQQVKSFYRLPVPAVALTDVERNYFTYIAQKSVYEALNFPSGPVHLNLPLRKPLLPQVAKNSVSDSDLACKPLIAPNTNQPDEKVIQQLFQLLNGKKGLLMAGPSVCQRADVAAIVDFAQQAQWPLVADPLSNIRGVDSAITSGDWIFKNWDNLPASYRPEVVLRFGATPVSAATASWLATSDVPIIYLDANRSLLDHTLSTTLALAHTPRTVLPQLDIKPVASDWIQQWQQLDAVIQATLTNGLCGVQLNEPLVARTLAQCLPAKSALFVSNSMPIREIDDYFNPQQPLKIFANRGANGIDGINSTALAMASQHQPAYLYIGDLAFFHDLTGLMMGKQYNLNLTIIVQNNNGGGIFSFLPQATEKTQFEKVFGTPLNIDIAAIAQLYQADYMKVTTVQNLKKALATMPDGLRIIEIPTSREDLVSGEQVLAKEITKRVQDLTHEN
ncbi:2-succinyl-5-enolpyruvyl-6-hydroxy-3-cyclohexene-1-carboxylic-acid synthase [Bombilactobacillus thymidiniphilus]|uniref:2-succinyl-5-enolpyruvyl-6-hydroxy-3-cyclohexene-1-carboxylate synthase n=1 Tax=Bombilactobacillus thymidiniphilus TaxID=2923363 RepID=A0ABY4PEC1_9LACO|nr:2-succinyl-5-enolpyruvyl-6-hydroxy-3-cyclohexene-1-carboxylic-acid synthase [Bombilactobacillus thymidiniphilus]UQS84139.1 2-succinyl-5-enolpyruvyl-6-hydroxy-3-cyclohexene-1-carboxylic-acid synthase [Bombilactobacillus thymidiniphilus]